MESDRVQAGGEDLLCSESGGGVGEAGELDWTRLDSYPFDDGRLSVPQREEGEEKKMSLIRLSLPGILCVRLSLVFLLHAAGRRSVTKALKSS